MERTTVRLTLRMPDELDNLLRTEAKRKELSINQLMLSIIYKELNHQKQSDHFVPRTL